MIIGIDFDDTINNLLQFWVKYLNDKYCLNVKYEDIIDWNMQLAYPTLTETEIREPLFTPSFWDTVTIKDDTYNIIKHWIQDCGHEVYIVTSTHFNAAPEKFKRCLFKYFDFLTYKNIIITYNKQLLNLDVMIDDYENNLEGGNFVRILFSTPYNKNKKTCAHFRVNSWNEIDLIIKELESIYS